MSKKNEETKSVKEEVKEDKNTSKKTSKKEEKKSSKKGVKKEVIPHEKLETLVDLVYKSNKNRKELIVLLANNDYLGQFYTEEDMRRNGLYVKPSLTESEFKKIIGD